MIRRRTFLAGLGASAAIVSTATAQRSGARRIGLLMTQSENDPEAQARVGAFRAQLAQLGWIEGQNLLIDYRYEGGVPARAQSAARELVALGPDLILANGTPPTEALKSITSSIPIVFVVVTDPVGAGFVDSLSRPGANITGFSTFEPEIGGKWLELLREVSPGLRRVAGIRDPSLPGFAGVWRQIEEIAGKSGIAATSIGFRAPVDDLEATVASFAGQGDGGLIVFPTAINSLLRQRIFAIANGQRLPAIYPFQHYAQEGGLMAYGFDPVDLFRRGAAYVDRILKGAKPAELPVQTPVSFELIINLQAARQIGAVIPAALLARANTVIE